MRPQLAEDDIAQHLSLNERLRRLEQLVAGTAYGDTGWANLPFTSPWAMYDAVNWRARYRRFHGVVYVEGLVANTVAFAYGGGGSNLQIAQLPVGFRPDMTRMGEGHMDSSAGVLVVLRIDTHPDGTITIAPNSDWGGSPMAGTSPSIVAPNNGVAAWLKLTIPPFIAE
jgi:hypothetical protein